VKIRLSGTRGEIAEVMPALQAALDVREISDFYPNRGSSTLGRVYVDAVPRTTGGDQSESAR
jgi:hypothetical protein